MKKLVSLMLAIVIAICTSNALYADALAPESGPQIVKEADLLVEKLHIKGDTAIKFVKIYTDYRTEMEQILEKNKPMKGAVVNGKREPLTEQQIDENVRIGFKTGRKMIDVREKYYKQFKTILPASKIEKMFRYEKKILEHKRKELKKRDSIRKDAAKKREKAAKKRAEAAKKRAESAKKRHGMAEKNRNKTEFLVKCKIDERGMCLMMGASPFFAR